MIEKRDTRWRARLRLQGQPQLSRTFTTEAAARLWESEMLDAARGGRLASVVASDIAFSEVLDHYEQHRTPHKRGALQERRRIAALRQSPLAPLKVSAISRRVLREYRAERLKSIRESSWNRILSLISCCLKHASLEFDAAIDVRSITAGLRGKESPGRTGRITPEIEAALLAAAPKVAPWAGAMIRLSLALGTRRGELWSLQHADVDRTAMSVRVNGTKTVGSVRTIPVSVGTLAVIDTLPRSMADGRILWQAEDAELLTYVWRRCATLAGRRDVCMHLARHEAISRLAERGASIPLLRSFSGHQTLAMLARYARPEAEALRLLVAA